MIPDNNFSDLSPNTEQSEQTTNELTLLNTMLELLEPINTKPHPTTKAPSLLSGNNKSNNQFKITLEPNARPPTSNIQDPSTRGLHSKRVPFIRPSKKRRYHLLAIGPPPTSGSTPHR